MGDVKVTFLRREPLQFPVTHAIPACHPALGGAHRWEISGRASADGLVTMCGGCGEERAWVVRQPSRVAAGAVIQFPQRSLPDPLKPAA